MNSFAAAKLRAFHLKNDSLCYSIPRYWNEDLVAATKVRAFASNPVRGFERFWVGSKDRPSDYMQGLLVKFGGLSG